MCTLLELISNSGNIYDVLICVECTQNRGAPEVGCSPEWFRFLGSYGHIYMLSLWCALGGVWAEWDMWDFALCEIITSAAAAATNSTLP